MRTSLRAIPIVLLTSLPQFVVAQQGDYEPAGEIAPTSGGQCDALDARWDARVVALMRAHHACLDASHKRNNECGRLKESAACTAQLGPPPRGTPWHSVQACGDPVFVLYRFQVCASQAHAFSCARGRRKHAVGECWAKLRAYNNNRGREEAERHRAQSEATRQAEAQRQADAQQRAAVEAQRQAQVAAQQRAAAEAQQRQAQAAQQAMEVQRQWMEAQRQAQAEAQARYQAQLQEMQRQQLARQQASAQLQQNLRVASEQRQAETAQQARVRADSAVRTALESWRPPKTYDTTSGPDVIAGGTVPSRFGSLVDPFSTPARQTGLDEIFATFGALTPPSATIPFAFLENIVRSEFRLLEDIDHLARNLDTATPEMADQALTEFGQRAFGPRAFYQVLGEHYLGTLATGAVQGARRTGVGFVGTTFTRETSRAFAPGVQEFVRPSQLRPYWVTRPASVAVGAGGAGNAGQLTARMPDARIDFAPRGLDDTSVVLGLNEHWLVTMFYDQLDERLARRLLEQLQAAASTPDSRR